MPVKSAHDLVMAAKQRCQEVELEKADAAIRQANVLIDVREPDEYSAGHLTGAINWPRGLLEFKLSSSPDLEQRDLSIVVYCRTGGRSALAACSMLANANFRTPGRLPVCTTSNDWLVTTQIVRPMPTDRPVA